MTELAYIDRLPCDGCEWNRLIRDEPPYRVCQLSRTGISRSLDEMTGDDCDQLAAAQDLSDTAVKVAEWFSHRMRHTPRHVHDLSIGAAADWLSSWAYDLDVRFAVEVWERDCSPNAVAA